ncbi:MAG: Gfo/Idh/MocA family protein [Opitutales bacterium]
MAKERLRWGVLGTGGIAAKVMDRVAEEAQFSKPVACASRDAAKAEAFRAKCGLERAYGSYDALLADPEVDAVYNALPNHLHAPWSIRALEAGKHVLCEKPLAMTEAEAVTVIAVARREKRFLGEAFMYRHHPQLAELRGLLASERLGKVRLIETRFSFNNPDAEATGNVRFARDMGGGGLMDVGCYCLSAARLVAGAATEQPFAAAQKHEVTAAFNAPDGVDVLATGHLTFEDGLLGNYACGMLCQTNARITAWCEGGYVELPNPWFPRVGQIRIHESAREPEILKPEAPQDLYALQFDNCARWIAEGRLEPSQDVMCWEDSLQNLQALDHARRQIGLFWPGEPS